GTAAAPAQKPVSKPMAPVLPPLPKNLRVGSPRDVARALLTCARHRLDGVAVFADGASSLKLAFLRGVVVGAGDNLREHLLGERLYKQGKLSTDAMRVLNARIASSGERVA